jgi:nucleotide-binding universal stress UspA family protein
MYQKILSYAEKNHVDLIVMSTHGRSGLSHFLFGSVAEKVSRHSRVPVLLISPEGCRAF